MSCVEQGWLCTISRRVTSPTPYHPAANLSWIQVHHRTLPLWNPYTALGMPLAFSLAGRIVSVPTLIGYLFPYNLAFTVQLLSP